jgi:hypothetical protein
LVLALLTGSSQVHAQPGQCLAGGCAGPGTVRGVAQTTTSGVFVNSVAGTLAGEYNLYNVTAGQQYEWSLCPADGAVNPTGDAQMTLKTTANVTLCFSDDLCGLAPKILWTSTLTGQVRVLVNQFSCVSNALSHTVRWRCVSCAPPPVGCVNTSQFPTGFVAAPTTSTAVTISTCNFQTEYSAISGIVAGSTYQVNSSCGGYITVRQGTFNGAVVAQGNAPLVFVAPASGNFFIHWNTNAACGTASTCCTTSIACTSCAAPVGCVNTSPFGSVAAPINADPVVISTCNFQSEYSTITGVAAGSTYQLGSSCGGYVTVRQNTFNGPIVAQGPAPLNFVAPAGGTYFVHWNTTAACGTATVCCTTTITCTSCLANGCVNTIPFGTVAAPTNDTPVIISICSFQNEYSTITGAAAGATYVIGSSCGGFITVRQNTFNGPEVISGPAPLTFTPATSGTYFVHWNTDVACGTATECCETTITCTTCIGGGTGGIQIQQNLTPVQLITDVFLGECLSASNIVYTGANVAVGTFTNGYAMGIDEGIIITTGTALGALGPNLTGSASTTNASGGNALLSTLAGQTTDDAAVFTFNFVPETDEVTFTYVFASEEYPEFVCSNFNDVFGFFVTGPGYAPNTNIAQIPGTSLPVAINTVNPGVPGGLYLGSGCTSLGYAGLYVDNTGGTHNQYDGRTVPLTATITTIPCSTYTITIAIADAADNAFDSAVLLKAQSFSAGVELELAANTQSSTSTPLNCDDEGSFVFTLDQPLPQSVTLVYLVQQVGTTVYNPPIPFEVTFPAGSTQVVIPVTAVPGTSGQNVSTVTITLDTAPYEELGCTCTPTNSTLQATLYICDPLTLPVRWLDFQAVPDEVGRRVDVAWSTATETNCASFTVERSTDLEHWSDIGSLPGAGTTTTTHTYAYRDAGPVVGTSYYRVRQTDMSGISGHSEVRTVHLQRTGLSAFPNPGQGVFTLGGHTGGRVRVLDMSGRQVPFHLDATGRLVLLDPAPGAFLLEVQWPDGGLPDRLRLMVK